MSAVVEERTKRKRRRRRGKMRRSKRRKRRRRKRKKRRRRRWRRRKRRRKKGGKTFLSTLHLERQWASLLLRGTARDYCHSTFEDNEQSLSFRRQGTRKSEWWTGGGGRVRRDGLIGRGRGWGGEGGVMKERREAFTDMFLLKLATL